MVALDEHDRNYIRDEMRRVEDHLGDKIKLVEKEVMAHLGDRFAHGWDHHLIERASAQQEEWMRWRGGVDRWRWMIVGGLVVVSVEAPILTALLSLFHGGRP